LPGSVTEAGGVARGEGGAAGVPGIEVRKFHAEDGGLKFVEARIVAVKVVVVAALDAVDAQHPQLLRQGLVLGDDHAAVAVGTEVLGGIKAEAAECAL
jgi:hypothetical protein